MNLSALKSITIPEGAVKKIINASGDVLWSAIEKVKIPVTLAGAVESGTMSQVTINEVVYTNSISDILYVYAGDIIIFNVASSFTYDGQSTLTIDNEVIFTMQGGTQTYEWVIPENTLSILINFNGQGLGFTVTTEKS